MKLDKVITIAIGRDGRNGTLKSSTWLEFIRLTRTTISTHATLVAAATGAGVGSDDDRDGKPEETAVFVAVNPDNVSKLRSELASLLSRYGQSSACFALDTHHEPAWATATGERSEVLA